MRGLRLLVAAIAAAAFLGPVGWVASDRLEADNDFCNACHLPDGVALHRGLRRDFDASPPVDLAGAHARAGAEHRDDGAFRCIDCHGGTSALGRARTKVLAAKDAFWYVVGHFEEPDGMRWPLWDEDCRRCHTRFQSTSEPGAPPAFHGLAVHNTALGVNCVECHLVHERGGNPDAWFVHAAAVRVQCARCHAELASASPQLEEEDG